MFRIFRMLARCSKCVFWNLWEISYQNRCSEFFSSKKNHRNLKKCWSKNFENVDENCFQIFGTPGQDFSDAPVELSAAPCQAWTTFAEVCVPFEIESHQRNILGTSGSDYLMTGEKIKNFVFSKCFPIFLVIFHVFWWFWGAQMLKSPPRGARIPKCTKKC